LHAHSDGTTRQITESEGLPSESITCWLEDQEGNIWVGTAAGGIARIRERIFKEHGVADGLPEKMVRSVGVDAGGDVWAGTMSGQLARGVDGKFTALSLPPAQSTPIAGISVFPSRSGKVWIGGLYHGLLVYDQGKISRPIARADPWIIQVLFEDSRNALWLGCRGQLIRITDGKTRFFGEQDGFPTGVPIGAIAEDAGGVMWIGTEQGDLWRYKEDQFARFHPPAEWPSSQIISLQTDASGVVWVGTLGNGLLRFKDGGFARFTTSEGLPDNNVSQLLDDGIGGLWGGTFAGVFHVEKSELDELAAGTLQRLGCSVYGTQDGLPALECTSGFNPACWRADDGRLWFSTVNGIASVNPASVRFNRRPPNVLIEELNVDGKPGLKLAPDGELKVGPGKHFLQFRFTGLSLVAPDKVRFRWTLEGVDRDWQDIGNQRVIGCGPLEPGRYRLRVRACNSDGVWNDEGGSVAFTVMPNFWETWWFKVVALAVSVAVIILALRRRYRLSMKRLKRENEVEQERSRIAQDLHDDLGTSLTQIIMLSSLANLDQTPPEKARQLIEQVGGRSKEMVTALDEIVWAVNPKNDTLVALVRYLGHFAEELLQPAGVRCRLDIPHGLPAHPLSAEVRHHLFLAFKEALNNCIRHSGASLVQLGVDLKPDEVIISVADDGRGFDPESGPSDDDGNGLLNIPSRMASIGGHAEIQSAPGRGTTVTLRLPLAARNDR
jgi:signal transduction histidine kinase/ligand-binding sensor domain-containing protein